VRCLLVDEGSLHLGEQGDEQERDAAYAYAVAGGVDRQRVASDRIPMPRSASSCTRLSTRAGYGPPVKGVHDDHIASSCVGQ
jgi:hypothetical protein